MSTSPLLPCKDPPLLQRLTFRTSSSAAHSMDADVRRLPGAGGGGGRRGGGDGAGRGDVRPAVPLREPIIHPPQQHPHLPHHPHHPLQQHPHHHHQQQQHGGPHSHLHLHTTAVHQPQQQQQPPPLLPRGMSSHHNTRRIPSTPPIPNNTENIRTPSINSRPLAPSQRARLGEGPASLQVSRTGHRSMNEYVDTPRLAGGTLKSQYEDRQVLDNLLPVRENHASPGNNNNSTGIITNQPQPSGLKANNTKDHSGSNHTNIKGQEESLAPDPLIQRSSRRLDEPHESIICSKCRKCKCSACVSPKKLPSTWVCNGRCNCSADTVVDYCSCLFCVQSVFYHCTNLDNDNNTHVSDSPCACCSVDHCCQRWTCMGLMSLCLPCLCLYWPLRGLVALSKLCYNGCSRRGCQCHREKNSGQALTKRPLIDSESSQSSTA